MYTYQYPHPAVTTDSVVFGLADGELKILLIRRLNDPYKDRWALPGGFIRMDEDLDTAAFRELKEETGVDNLYLEQLGAWGTPGRDPRERIITIAYLAIVNLFEHPVKADSDAREAGWFPVVDPPPLSFDHGDILAAGLKRLQEKVRSDPVVFRFLPEKFTLSQVQRLYEAILYEGLDKRNFRKKLLATGLLEALDEYEADVAHRAAQYYRFNWRYEKTAGEGFAFRM